jgi:hypothetical protein
MVLSASSIYSQDAIKNASFSVFGLGFHSGFGAKKNRQSNCFGHK